MADAFDNLLSARVEKGAEALELLVDQLNNDKERTVYEFLNNRGSEDVLWALISMLSSENTRIASNSAFVIGSLSETEEGSTRIFSILKIADQKNVNVLEKLTMMLAVEDAETVMNAAGTLGTLAETEEGRSWMLNQECAYSMMTNTTFLLGSENNWTASNSALVLARMTISESGRKALLEHPRSNYILQRLIQSLGNDSAGRGMNSAFAIGRLLDTKIGKERLLNGTNTDKMTTSLCRMLAKGDMGGAKNACFAISCLAADSDGNQLVLANNFIQDAVNRLVLLLQSDDSEACWFAAMTLKTISSHKHGVLRLRQNTDVENSLTKVFDRPQISKELNDEVTSALANLKKLNQPDPPYVEVAGSTSVRVMWNRVPASCGFQVTYKLMCDNKIVYKGPDLEYVISNLHPYTPYSIKLRASTMGDDSPYSETVTVTTDEDVPTAPTFFQVMGCTPTQLRLTWNSPKHCNGVMRGYCIYLGEKLLECIQDASFIISRLTPATKYTIHVCASTSKGNGERATVDATTEELGAHAPEKPTVTVIGRNEIQVAWMPPTVPLGRFFRYELCMNGRVVYQGIDKFYRVTGLTPDTEYTFVAVAITTEGRCASDPTKKKTPKDKLHNEPGHHQLKTHSFKAKEFQAMQEKSKSQTNLIPPIQRPKPKHKKRNSNTNRPGSNISMSNESDISVLTDGTWAFGTNEVNDPASDKNFSVNVNPQGENNQREKKRFQNAAVIGGSQVVSSQARATGMTVISTTSDARYSEMGNSKEEQAGSSEENHMKPTPTHQYKNAQAPNLPSGKTKEPIIRKHTFDKENRRQLKTSSMTRTRFRRGHAVMKGKKVLKSDKELLAEIANQGSKLRTSGSDRKMSSGTNSDQRTMHYYPDIVSAIRKQYGHEDTIEDDLNKGRLVNKTSLDSPDSLNPEPGTARNGLDIDTSTLKIKADLLKKRVLRDLTTYQYSTHTYPGSRASTQSLNASRSASKPGHMIVKPAANSRYGLKYNIQSDHSNGSLLSTEVDSAFHSLTNMKESIEDGSHQWHSSAASELTDFWGNTPAGYSDPYVQARTVSSRLKTPPKGYWSDHDVGRPREKKKPPLLSAINYRKFQGAHRPTKSIRLESPVISNLENGQWIIGESVYSSDINRSKFTPTQWRTQPANLPAKPKSGHMQYRLDPLNNRMKQTEASSRMTSSSQNYRHNMRSPHAILSKQLNQKHDANERGIRSREVSKDSRWQRQNKTTGEDISTSVLRLKTGSMLAALNYHSGHGSVSSNVFSQAKRHTARHSNALSKTTTTVLHTILSPLSPSEATKATSSNTESISNLSSQSPKSPRLRLTTSSQTKSLSSVPTATGYAITPHHSLSSLSNDGGGSLLTTTVPSAGDLV